MATIVIPDEATTKLCTDKDGIVWEAVGESPPRNTKMIVADYATKLVPARYRLPATLPNIPLILLISEKFKRGQVDSLEICSPALCFVPSDNVEIFLYNSRRIDAVPASCGGWHTFTETDKVSCTLALFAYDIVPWSSEDVEALLEAHPVTHSMSFIYGLNYDALARIIGRIVDPRFYVDYRNPEIVSYRLFNRLGVSLEKVRFYMEHQKDYETLLDSIVKCWRGRRPSRREVLAEKAPREFLWREFYSKEDEVFGMTVACRLFVSFLVHVWTSFVCCEAQREHIFSPELFFKDPDDAKAYRHYMYGL